MAATPHRQRCEQMIQRGGRCLQSATWVDRSGELYCTQHANYYMISTRNRGTKLLPEVSDPDIGRDAENYWDNIDNDREDG